MGLLWFVETMLRFFRRHREQASSAIDTVTPQLFTIPAMRLAVPVQGIVLHAHRSRTIFQNLGGLGRSGFAPKPLTVGESVQLALAYEPPDGLARQSPALKTANVGLAGLLPVDLSLSDSGNALLKKLSQSSVIYSTQIRGMERSAKVAE
ncbi:MAG: hypothetical protein LR015_01165 [Verrucomicrobia bacterium]|nr:hypothetical protein [Verrucomicrobiota bacterium]